MQDKLEEQMISRYAEMCQHVYKLREEALLAEKRAAEFAYDAALQFPDFIDHVCEKKVLPAVLDPDLSPDHRQLEPADLVTQIVFWRCGVYPPSERMREKQVERRKNESSRHWLERVEEHTRKKLENTTGCQRT
jgi:hypothetical protein